MGYWPGDISRRSARQTIMVAFGDDPKSRLQNKFMRRRVSLPVVSPSIRHASFHVMMLLTVCGCKKVETHSHKDGLNPSGRVNFTPSHVNVGRIPDAQTRWANFTVNNTTPYEVKIEKIKTSCGCTEATADRTLVPSGGTATVTIPMCRAFVGQSTPMT